MDMQKKEDLRIRKTKANLYKALLQVMSQKTFEEIKVTDICNVSMINRSTFYDHFSDKYELLASLLKDLNNELISHLRIDKEITSLKEYYVELIKHIIDFQNKNLNIFSAFAILRKNNNSIAYDMLREAIQQEVCKKINEEYINKSKVPAEIISLFYVSAVISVAMEIIQDKNKYTDEDLITYLEQLIPEVDYLSNCLVKVFSSALIISPTLAIKAS